MRIYITGYMDDQELTSLLMASGVKPTMDKHYIVQMFNSLYGAKEFLRSDLKKGMDLVSDESASRDYYFIHEYEVPMPIYNLYFSKEESSRIFDAKTIRDFILTKQRFEVENKTRRYIAI